jgi:uncharacterized protein involved in exopolysaccharide biosynthesis
MPHEIDLIDLWAVVASRRKLMTKATATGLVLATAIAFLLPDTYTASAMIMAPQQQQSVAAMLAGQLAGMAASAKDLGLKNPGDVYAGILASRSIADEIIRKFRLQEVYRRSTIEETRKQLAKNTVIEAGNDTLIRIQVSDRDAARAATIANHYVNQLHAHNSRLALSESAQRRMFFEQQLSSEKQAIAAAEAAMRHMQERTGVLAITGQVEASIGSVAQLRAEIASREVLLGRLRAGATDQNPEVVRLKAELSALRSQLAGLQTGSTRTQGDPYLSPAAVPEKSLEYMRNLRDLKYHEGLFELLAKQFEAARIDEARQAPVIQIVDVAVPPDKRDGPFRTAIIAAGGLGSLLAAAAYVLWDRKYRQMRAEYAARQEMSTDLRNLAASSRI